MSVVTKIKILLDKFVEEKCQIQTDENLDNLLTYQTAETLLPTFNEWIKQAVASWSASRVAPPPNIISFAVNLTSFLAKNEDRFLELNDSDLFRKLLKIRQPRVKVVYQNLIFSFLEHKSGVEYIISCKFWEDFILDQNDRFLSEFLEKTVDQNENVCDAVVKRLMSPLTGDEIRSQDIKLVDNILLYFLEGICSGTKNFKVVLRFLKHFQEDKKFVQLSQTKSLAKFLLTMQFLELHVTVGNHDETVSRIKNNFFVNLSKDNFDDFIDFCSFGFLYWKLMDSKTTLWSKDQKESFSFSNELVGMYVLPQYCLMLKYCLRYHEIEEACLADEIRDLFVDRILKLHQCYAFHRLFYSWRDRLVACHDLFQTCIRSLDHIKASRKYFTRYQAVVVFQVGIYLLKDIIQSIQKFPQKLELFQNESLYISSIFHLLGVFIKEFKITWKDSFETVDVIDVSCDFLSLSGWSTNVVVQGFNLINIAVSKYMSPHLALLVEHTVDPIVAALASLLRDQMVHEAAEVKGSVLEVICTMARISNSSKFSVNLCSFCTILSSLFNIFD